ncbi:MAG: winged helix DNA-binding protein [Methanobrevibacter sp.]|uniref:winged helix DNA-binding protein n=1 Tax=Methanobrevibacter sp. TaxID=66852 RepID=UPI0025E5456A|nr:winged helix DNA-binding protein [Methanobrevibacter sp.]MBQ6100258.1 winged helix DNA-binding protein [Methanobrevibacter sp.]
MDLSDEMLMEIYYVKTSKIRNKIMKTLKREVKIPSKISDDTKIGRNHVSKALGELKDHGLVECINPEMRKGKLYRLTEKGKIVSRYLS